MSSRPKNAATTGGQVGVDQRAEHGDAEDLAYLA